MIINKMIKLFIYSFILPFLIITQALGNEDFNQWLKKFKSQAINYGVSERVVTDVMSEAKFLPKVIEYDRFQPEFYEDTFTYIKKGHQIVKLKKV